MVLKTVQTCAIWANFLVHQWKILLAIFSLELQITWKITGANPEQLMEWNFMLTHSYAVVNSHTSYNRMTSKRLKNDIAPHHKKIKRHFLRFLPTILWNLKTGTTLFAKPHTHVKDHVIYLDDLLLNSSSDFIPVATFNKSRYEYALIFEAHIGKHLSYMVSQILSQCNSAIKLLSCFHSHWNGPASTHLLKCCATVLTHWRNPKHIYVNCKILPAPQVQTKYPKKLNFFCKN